MRCKVCRKRLPDDIKFCAYCGASLPAAPGPLPPLRWEPADWRRLLTGLSLGLPVGTAFWLVAGWAAQWPVEQSLALGALLGGLAGLASSLLHARLFWPLLYRPALLRGSVGLPVLYGLGGGLALLAGGAPIGLIVLLLGWGLVPLSVEAFIAGIVAGAVTLRFALPLGSLAGVATGWLMGRLGRRMKGTLGLALAAGLAWVNAGAVGGALLGVVVASRVDLDPSLGAFAGALIQVVLGVLLLPVGVRVARRLIIFWSNLP